MYEVFYFLLCRPGSLFATESCRPQQVRLRLDHEMTIIHEVMRGGFILSINRSCRSILYESLSCILAALLLADREC